MNTSIHFSKFRVFQNLFPADLAILRSILMNVCQDFATPLRKCQKHIEVYLKFKKYCAKFPEISKLEESIEYLILKNE